MKLKVKTIILVILKNKFKEYAMPGNTAPPAGYDVKNPKDVYIIPPITPDNPTPPQTTAGDYQMYIQTSDILGNTATMTLPYTINPAEEPNTPTKPETPGNPTQPQAHDNSNGATGGGSGVAQGSASNGGGLSPSGRSGDESQNKFPPT